MDKQTLEQRVKEEKGDNMRDLVCWGSAVAGAGLAVAGAGRGLDAMGAVDLGEYPGIYTGVGIPVALKMATYFNFSPKEIPGYAAYGAGIALAHADKWLPGVYDYLF